MKVPDTQAYIGLSVQEAKDLAADEHFSHRIVREDNKDYIIRDDMKTNRLNFEVENNIIINWYTG